MKIGILLPYKKIFHPSILALFLYLSTRQVKQVNIKNIIVFGNTNYKRKFNIKYCNIDLFKNPLEAKLNCM